MLSFTSGEVSAACTTSRGINNRLTNSPQIEVVLKFMVLLFRRGWFSTCWNEFFARTRRLERRFALKQALSHEEAIGGDEGDGLPGVFIEEAVSLTFGELQLGRCVAEALELCLRGIPAGLPGILRTKKYNGGGKTWLDLFQNIDFRILFVIRRESGIEEQVSDNRSIDVLGVGRIVQAWV